MSGWKQANYFGILTSGKPNDPKASFNAGRLYDVLLLGDKSLTDVLVAASNSGVWSVSPTGNVIPLSYNSVWAKPNLNSLALGLDGIQKVYAGGDWLYETIKKDNLVEWRQIPVNDAASKPLDYGVIWDIVAIQDGRKLVLACSNGVFWADIPKTGDTYLFKQALPVPGYAGKFSGVAEGPNGTVVVAAWGDINLDYYGLYDGNWLSGDLTFSPASIIGDIQPEKMLRTSIASCPLNNRQVMYAAAGFYYYTDAKGNTVQDPTGNQQHDTLYRVLRSKDGGKSWKVTGSTVKDYPSQPLFGDPGLFKNIAGDQSNYNNCIAVHPTDSNLVALGWRNGYFVSSDAGDIWTYVPAGGSPDLHSDLHALAFDQFDQKKETIYIGSDGGLFITRDLGTSHESQSNQKLPNLLFNRIAASPQVRGLLAGSLQDNGTLFSLLYPSPAPWQSVDGGDGYADCFIKNGEHCELLHNEDVYSSAIRDARWDQKGATFQEQNYGNDQTGGLANGVIPLDGMKAPLGPTNPPGLTNQPVLEIVNHPTWKDSQELMVALGGKDASLYGLFVKDSGDLHWKKEGTIPVQKDKQGNPEHITSVGSSEGNPVFVGTNMGRIFKVSLPDGGSTEITPPENTGSISRLAVPSATLVFAVASGKRVYKRSGGTWTTLPTPAGATGDYTSIETDWTTDPTLFLSTDNRVYSSSDGGNDWNDISAGLPETPHCKDLRFVKEPNGAELLFLGTYGYSVWRFLVTAAPDNTGKGKSGGIPDPPDHTPTTGTNVKTTRSHRRNKAT
jgi:photosystem II stability/assembly factor-like uncharacterized protein